MKRERWVELMENESLPLSPEEIADGWHFCIEWDGLLIHPDDEEAKHCDCPYKKPKGEPE